MLINNKAALKHEASGYDGACLLLQLRVFFLGRSSILCFVWRREDTKCIFKEGIIHIVRKLFLKALGKVWCRDSLSDFIDGSQGYFLDHHLLIFKRIILAMVEVKSDIQVIYLPILGIRFLYLKPNLIDKAKCLIFLG